jgi:hypothetical protein
LGKQSLPSYQIGCTAAAAASNIIRAANPALLYAGYNDAINGIDHENDHKNDLTQKLHQKQYK